LPEHLARGSSGAVHRGEGSPDQLDLCAHVGSWVFAAALSDDEPSMRGATGVASSIVIEAGASYDYFARNFQP
jgi:hypothetical protein